MIEKALRDHLLTTYPQTYHSAIPQGVKGPCLTLQVTSKQREYTQAAYSSVCTTTFLVGAWVVSDNEITGYYAAKDLAEQVKDTLEAANGATLDIHTIYSVMVENESDSTPQYLDGQDYLVLGVNLTAKIVHTQ